jgi:hypothetical protein
MKQLITIFMLGLLVSCKGHPGGALSVLSEQAPKASADPAKPLMDTEKLKQDIGDVMRSMDARDARDAADTNALKRAASDILTTDANVLSDSGIDQLGDKNDPSVKAAQDALKKMRNSMGITPAQLDSIRKAGASLH